MKYQLMLGFQDKEGGLLHFHTTVWFALNNIFHIECSVM